MLNPLCLGISNSTSQNILPVKKRTYPNVLYNNEFGFYDLAMKSMISKYGITVLVNSFYATVTYKLNTAHVEKNFYTIPASCLPNFVKCGNSTCISLYPVKKLSILSELSR